MSVYFNRFVLASQNKDATVRLLVQHQQQRLFDGIMPIQTAKDLYLALRKVLENYEGEHGSVMPNMEILKQLGVAPEDV